ncbi:hypothetical protein G4B88_007039 [Cannabis sativa]|uniref:Uncharacterized protein n=1 Tax=Cannabis sativa TaxID=3483 RepID=A0A7J6FNQ5_CANSA|nr:hypothetical protein G4B88_007039 [Cannabis sativa]
MASRRRNFNTLFSFMVKTRKTVQIQHLYIYKVNKEKEIVLEDITSKEQEDKLIKKMIIIALWCIQLNPSDRPSKQNVIKNARR